MEVNMELKPFQKKVWAEIDLDAATYNYNQIRKCLNHNTRLCCVLKGDGYGHGAVQMSKLYEQLGADYLAVSNIAEGLQIRNSGVKLPILILGYTDPQCVDLLAINNLSQCVFSYEYGKILSEYAEKTGMKVNIHIKMDTGLGRIGFKCDLKSLDKIVKVCSSPFLLNEGIFTQFAVADEGVKGKTYTEYQFNTFLSSIDYLEKKGVIFKLKHCANSACIFDYPEMHLDMVRPGIALYGLQPSCVLQNPVNLHPVRSLKTVIVYIKNVLAGEYIGYGREFQADHDIKVATIPIGYADGLSSSNVKNRIRIEVEGSFATLVGRACMEQCMIDISNIPAASINSIVTIYDNSENNLTDYSAEDNKAINYEIGCNFGERNPKVYMKNGCIEEIVDNII